MADWLKAKARRLKRKYNKTKAWIEIIVEEITDPKINKDLDDKAEIIEKKETKKYWKKVKQQLAKLSRRFISSFELLI